MIEAANGIRASSFLDSEGLVWLPYDLSRVQAGSPRASLAPLPSMSGVKHRPTAEFRFHEMSTAPVHVMNGMGVALGDSIIGLSALHWLSRTTGRTFHVYRASEAPAYVEELYKLASWLGNIYYLPVPFDHVRREDGVVIDIGDIVNWPEFEQMPMIDFFLWALGVEPETVPVHAKTNAWLREVTLPMQPSGEEYLYFCPVASTALRSMPRALWVDTVERIWQRYRIPIVGPADILHPAYRCIAAEMPDTASFLACVARAAAVVTVDSAALHVAAGFDKPTLAMFNTIDPQLRMAYYPRCTSLDLRIEQLRGLHHTSDLVLLDRAAESWRAALRNEWPFPPIAKVASSVLTAAQAPPKAAPAPSQ